MYLSLISEYISQGDMPTWKDYQWGQYQAGSQGIVVHANETANNTFIIALISY